MLTSITHHSPPLIVLMPFANAAQMHCKNSANTVQIQCIAVQMPCKCIVNISANTCDACIVQIQYKCSANALQKQCRCGANAVQMQTALQMQCKYSENVVRTQFQRGVNAVQIQ